MKPIVTGILSGIIIFSSCSRPGEYIKSTEQGAAVDGKYAYIMLNLEEVNNPDKEWCYSPKSTTVIGVPFMPRPVQITFDGAIYTRDAEVCFFYSDRSLPLMARQKRYHNGWIPIVEDDWIEDGIAYYIEMFGAVVEGADSLNTIQFVRITMKNTTPDTTTVSFAAGFRYTGEDHRFKPPMDSIQTNTRFEMKHNMLIRDDQMIYIFPDSTSCFSIPWEKYHRPYTASDYSVDEESVTGISKYERKLAANESCRLIYKIPNFPVPVCEDHQMKAIREADFQVYYNRTVEFWQDLVERESTITIPEKRVNDSYKASLVHLMLATRKKPGEDKRQGSGLPYDRLYFNDYVDMRRVYDVTGHPEFVDVNVRWILNSQNQEGMFLDPGLTGKREIMASHGQAMVSLANHYVYTRDTSYARMIYPGICKAVRWMYKKHTEDPKGLMPPSVPFDAEMIKGYYTSHNLWCLLGLRDAIRVARGLGREEDVRAWTRFHDSYRKAILTALDTVTGEKSKNGGYVPAGLYDFITGPDAREGFREHQTNQDWENNLLAYPTEVLEPDDYRVKATLDTIRKRKYREGIMTYRNGMHLHQYVTVNQALQYLAINDQEHALLDLYHILLHNGSTHEGFENMVEPWEDMDAWPIPPPHAWAAAKTALLIRNMFVREQGGEAGLYENERNLYLFSVISPSWIQPGRSVIINNAVTEMGSISAELKFLESGAQILIKNQFHTPPSSIIIPVPWYVKVKEISTDATRFTRNEEYMVFSPDVSDITLRWKIKERKYNRIYQDILVGYREEPGLNWRNMLDAVIIPRSKGFLLEDEKEPLSEPLSFELVKKAFIKEYQRRYDDYVNAGKMPLKIVPPPLMPDE